MISDMRKRSKNKLYGAILGDLAGRLYEYNYKGNYSEFDIHDSRAHMTDDTILTLATAYAILENVKFPDAYKLFANKYKGDYYGKRFLNWVETGEGNDSWGNGCLMRVSPIMYAYHGYTRASMLTVSCMSTHSHIDSLYSVLTLGQIYTDKTSSREFRVSGRELNKFEKFEVGAKPTINFIKEAFYHSDSTHKTIEAVIKCGGDTDTNASIIGELMNYTFNDLSERDVDYVDSKLDDFLVSILKKFNKKFTNL